jgi:predicted ABC-class ATPase
MMGCVITGNMDTAIEYMLTFRQRTWAKGEIAILLRLSTHILLALRDIHVEHKEDAANEIVRQYVDALMEFHVVLHLQDAR